MAEPKKDTIYVDIDDEITGIIDKVRGSSGKVTALVLPKRAGVFQSIVNMKLLKRAASEADKNLVLITSEAGLLPLAGAAGIHVAKTLSSKPEIPVAPKLDDAGEEAIDEAGEVTKDTAGEQPVGKLASQPPADSAGVETLQLDDDELPEDAAADAKTPLAGKKPAVAAAVADKAAKGRGKGKSGNKFKIPNFGKFRKKLILGGIILLLLIIGIILGLIILPKATVNIKTDAQNVPVELNFNLSTAETQLDDSSDTPTVPAKLASEQKTYSQQVPTTGQKNHGNKASGQVTVTNCGSGDTTLPAGTGFSSSGNTYISQQSVTVPVSDFHGRDGPCQNNGKANVTVQAQSGGSAANLPAGASFSISGGPSGLTAQGNTMSGGTDNIVQTVNQNDINNAKAKIATNDNVQKQSLQNDLKKQKYFAITSTFSPGTPNVTQSAQVGDVANNVTVTEVVTYTMFGAKEKDLNTLVDNAVKEQVDTSKQTILSRGLDSASFTVNTSSSTSAQLALQTTAEVGPDLDINSIKQSALGKKPADVKSQVGNNPDITDVNVKLSPFWVSSVPKKASKVTVKIAKPTTTKSTNNANNSP
ncbi:MAG TPA: baseplate J/gp47 family protein [Candidatus Saccharimonadales bacterium]|nr:baseplate J/gp47 family protein [Candidatus Saccharimonadales bacterium]